MERRVDAVTTSGLSARLQQPEHVAAGLANDLESAAEVAAREATYRHIIADLRSEGVHVESLWSLCDQPDSGDAALPVLLNHLRRDYSERTRQDIGHALPFKPNATWWEDLKALYLVTSSDAVQDRLAATLSRCATTHHYDDLLAFVADKRLGESRVYFLRPINRIGSRIHAGAGLEVITAFTSDTTILGVEARRILAAQRSGRTRGHIAQPG